MSSWLLKKPPTPPSLQVVAGGQILATPPWLVRIGSTSSKIPHLRSRSRLFEEASPMETHPPHHHLGSSTERGSAAV
jgi:hypothetical protein